MHTLQASGCSFVIGWKEVPVSRQGNGHRVSHQRIPYNYIARSALIGQLDVDFPYAHARGKLAISMHRESFVVQSQNHAVSIERSTNVLAAVGRTLCTSKDRLQLGFLYPIESAQTS